MSYRQHLAEEAIRALRRGDRREYDRLTDQYKGRDRREETKPPEKPKKPFCMTGGHMDAGNE